jgi:flagellar biosynthesis GTPase FlhF
MKKILFSISLAVLILGFTTGRFIDDKMKNILQQIQLSEDGAKNMIWSNCAYSNFSFPNPLKLKSVAAGERASIVETVARYAKDYSASPEFLNKYNELRENKKPEPPEKPKTVDEMKEEQRKSMEESIKNMEETKLKMPADQQSMFDESINQFKQQLKEIDNPDNPMFSKEMEDMYKQMYDQQMTEYNSKLAEWQNDYPENNPSLVIKSWLTKFMDETKHIDFNAQTAADQYNRQIFVKQEYERKSYLWKLCYRAGKEATGAGRAFAQTWLGEL